ncbi:MAG: hypothetical protein IJE66_03415 [Akkermansia sp.]|nr:hypothetical protein [Akkermansia sp.]
MNRFCINFLWMMSLLLVGILRAATIESGGYEQTVTIRFPESVVHASAVRMSEDEPSGEAPDLFRISGDARHVPQTRWVDQDKLEVSFPAGSSCKTQYKLLFHEGTCYLGGAEMKKREYVFRCPENRLSIRPVATARGGALLVTPTHHHTREAQLFSEKSAVNYVFRRVKKSIWTGERYLGRSVAATVEPARVCDGVLEESLERLAAAGPKVWEKLKADSLLPGHVLVRPVEELDMDETWILCYSGEPNSGFIGAQQKAASNSSTPMPGYSDDFHPANELLSGLSAEEKATGDSEVMMTLFFSQPVPEKSLPELFSRLGFSINGEGTMEKTKSGRKLTVNEKIWLHFRYAGPLPYQPHGVYLPGAEGKRLAYQASGMASGMRILVSGVLPAVVDVSVPAGTASANGAVTRDEHVHRLALHPAWPQIQTDELTVLPLKGAHKLRLPTTNISRVDATVHRVHPRQVAEALMEPAYDSRDRDRYQYEYRIHRARKSKDLPAVSSALDAREKRLDEAEETLEAREELRNQYIADARSYPTRHFDLKGSSLFRSSELVLDLEALTGEKLQPGLYLITLRVTPNAHVQYALSLQGQRADALNYELDIPVLVTDLNVICAEQGVLVTRFSDGSVVTGAEMKSLEWNKATRAYEEVPLPDCSGVAFIRQDEAKSIIVRCGQDVAKGRIPSSYSRWMVQDETAKNAATRIFLLKDRSMYRPGEAVHLRGLVRRFKSDHYALPKEKQVTLTVLRPNLEKLSEQEIPLGEFGGFAADIQLPDGEEDVAGDYTVEVRAGGEKTSISVPCQVFRRNAFVATLTSDVEKVAPQKISLTVQADDYSGVPLSNAKVELKLRSGTVGETHRLVTDANGTAELTLPMKEEWLRQGELDIEGSVANDREEYVILPLRSETFSPADFCIDYRDSRLYLTDTLSGEPLGRDQLISIDLKVEGLQAQNPRACFSLMELMERKVASCELTIPAHARQGVPLPPNMLRALQEHGVEDEDFRYRMRLELRGRDAAGREAVHSTVPSVDTDAAETELFLRAEPLQDRLRLHFLSPRNGPVHVFIGCGERLRHVQRHAEKGEQTMDIHLQRLEEGTVSVSLVIPESGKNATRRLVTDNTTCFVPIARQHLDVSLLMPQGTTRPGQKILLSGQVLSAGKPADAEVTLYAVDEGMLSLQRYERPDPERFFASGRALTFEPASLEASPQCLSSEVMDAIWMGDMHRGDSVSLSPVLERKFLSKAKYLKKPVYAGFLTGGLRSGSSSTLSPADMNELLASYDDVEIMPAPTPVQPCIGEYTEENYRNDFEPVAVWKAALRTDAEGRFSAEAELPDTLTTYRVFAVAADRSGSRFGSAEDCFVVNLPVMITPGMPLFMSTGDTLKIPLSITNATDKAGSWKVTMEGCETPQLAELSPGGSSTLYFAVAPAQEGECRLRWKAEGASGTDAVQGTCTVRFPAPLLKEVHRPELLPGQEPLKLASLFASELAQSTRSEAELYLSSSPLLHLRGCLDFLLTYPYGCTEQKASALMPRLLYDELSPFCPKLAATPREEVTKEVEREIRALFARQCEDGGLGYWKAGENGCGWASAYAAMVLTVASERGYALPKDKMKRLLRFVERLDEDELFFEADLMAARALGDKRKLERRLRAKCDDIEKSQKNGSRPGVYGATIRFLQHLQHSASRGDAFRDWLRTVGRDARHHSTSHSSLMLLALHDFLRKQSVAASEVSVVTDSGSHQLKREPLKCPLPRVNRLAELPTTLAAEGGPVYALVQAKAQPQQTDFSGVTERGLQVTRVYEVQGEDGKWHRAPDQLKVGDVVRVTLTCAKVADELEYLVLEDYLPACMEAINPEIPSQAAGLEQVPWSSCFDHHEYLADRVRGFCSRWSGRDLLNMTYFARVKRAGASTAPPAQAQLMYEPQVYGLSPNSRVISVPVE